jgi:glycosidase
MPMIWQDEEYEPQAMDPRGREREPDEVEFDEELFNFYKRVIALRREHDALNHGDFAIVTTDDAQHVIVTSRTSKREKLIVAINRGEQDAHVHFDVHSPSGRLTPVFVTRGPAAIRTETTAQGIEFDLPSLTGIVFSCE